LKFKRKEELRFFLLIFEKGGFNMKTNLNEIISIYTEKIEKEGFKKKVLSKLLKLFPELIEPKYSEKKFISSFEQIILQWIKFGDIEKPGYRFIFRRQNLVSSNLMLMFLFYIVIDYDKFEFDIVKQLIEESNYMDTTKYKNLKHRIIALFLENDDLDKNIRLWLELQ
jgi:cell division protein FtsB